MYEREREREKKEKKKKIRKRDEKIRYYNLRGLHVYSSGRFL